MKTRTNTFITVLIALISMESNAGFIGDLLLKPDKPPRYVLMKDFSYKDPKGKIWTTKQGYKTDGASIPRVLWSVIGDPYGGGYIKSAVIHDQACDDRKSTWQDTHRVFFDAMLDAGVSPTKAYILYIAVYNYGPRWSFKMVNVPNYSVRTTSTLPSVSSQMTSSVCPICRPVNTLDIEEKRELRTFDTVSTEEVLDNSPLFNEELTEDKLKLIELAVKKLEGQGDVKVEDLEKLANELK